ncbi:globin [Ornithinimicrobium sufpigmenti]|uniref:globin n=1 Tax=Ornithinimicrobium sufpigmenti TaxID=2508882 RepID=UPI0010357D29|nr:MULTISPECIES: globin [unclassified Ornithinimicrobium]
MTTTQQTFYDRVGGHETFVDLVAAFYRGVAQDPPLRDLYPEEDLGPAQDRLLLFLEQYWGGPTTYQETRGHPRLRMRHAPYRVTPTQRDRWLRHMNAAIDTICDRLGPMDEQVMRDYMAHAAQAMVNTLDDPEA